MKFYLAPTARARRSRHHRLRRPARRQVVPCRRTGAMAAPPPGIAAIAAEGRRRSSPLQWVVTLVRWNGGPGPNPRRVIAGLRSRPRRLSPPDAERRRRRPHPRRRPQHPRRQDWAGGSTKLLRSWRHTTTRLRCGRRPMIEVNII
jgi:hypothetical protein